MEKLKGKRIRRLSFLLAMLMILQSIFAEAGTGVSRMSLVKGEVLDAAGEELEDLAEEMPKAESVITEESSQIVASTPLTEDMVVSAGKILTEDMIVNNLTVTKDCLNLNGYKLTVLGDITLSGGSIYVNGGNIVCHGDCTVSGTAYITMNSQDDYMKVLGDFTTKSRTFTSITSGLLELRGDFSQVNDTDYDVFCTSGTSEVFFSGSQKQQINFESDKCYFTNVTLNNTSNDGVRSEGLIHSLAMTRNDTKVVCGIEGTWGWKLTENETFAGNLILLGDTLDLNGYTLNVTGNFVHANGTVRLNGGELKVSGDYRMQKPSVDETNMEISYIPSVSVLKMTNVGDLLDIEGNMYMQSQIATGNNITDGTIKVAGNVSQLSSGVNNNFSLTGGNVLVMDGNKKQTISFAGSSRTYSYLNDLEIDNKKGVEFLTDIYVLGNVNDRGNPVTGCSLVPCTATSFENDSFTGNLRINDSEEIILKLSTLGGDLYVEESVCIGANLVVEGNLTTVATLYTCGYSLEIEGDTSIGGSLTVTAGKVIFSGDCSLVSLGYLDMVNINSYVLVKGNMTVASTCTVDCMTCGTLEIKGDFTHKTTDHTGNFRASNTHTTIFSGTSKQTVIFEDDYSYFGTVEIKNESEEGIYAPDGINCSMINTNSNTVTTNLEGMEGWTLSDNQTYDGDLEIIGGTLDLNGYTLKITGNFIQSSGIVRINGGKLIVEGDYRIQSREEKETEVGELGGTQVIYGKSTGYLNMTKAADTIVVKGLFVMGSMYSHSSYLTKGTLKVAGDVQAIQYDSTANFACMDDLELILNGNAKQTVMFDYPAFGYMNIGKLTVNNESEDGVVFGSLIPVSGAVVDNGNKIDGTIVVTSTTTFDNNEAVCSIKTSRILSGLCGLTKVNGDVTLPHNLYLNGNLEITGDVGSSGSGNRIELNGYTLDIGGNVTLQGNHIAIEQGKLYVGGNLILAYDNYYAGYLRMDNAADYVCIGGNFMAGTSSSSGSYNNGILEIKGDFIQNNEKYTSNFITGASCKVLFSGDKLQTVLFNGYDSYFGNVELTNKSEEGVYSAEGIHCTNLTTNGNVYRTGYEGTLGWTLSENQEIDGELILAGGVLDLNGHKLTIKGDFLELSGFVKVNGGELVVEGNYNIQSAAGTGTWAGLHMTNEKDRVIVKGSFSTSSYASHIEYLTAGTMFVAGNLIEKSTLSAANFKSSGTFMLTLNGSEAQSVSFAKEDSIDSSITNITIDNSSEEGVALNSTLLTGNVVIRNGRISDVVSICGSTSFENNTYDGDVQVNVSTTLANPLTVNGNLTLNGATSIYLGGDILVNGNFYGNSYGYYLYLSGHTLEVKGDAVFYGRMVSFSGGKLLCRGDLNLKYFAGCRSGLEMTNETDYVLVEGDMYADSYRTTIMSYGTMELKGDFISTTNNSYVCFYQYADGKVIFSGDSLQTVSIANASSTLGTIVIKNASKDGVHFVGNIIKALNIEKNGNYVYCDGEGEFGWTLNEDTIIEGNLIIIGEELNLNGHTLTVNGDLFLNAGSININKGTLEVNGDFCIEGYREDGNHICSTGKLIMTKGSDRVVVDGAFVCASSQSSSGNLTAGTMELHGDFSQLDITGANMASFVSTGTHTVLLNGSKEQKVSFDNYRSSCFNNVIFNNKDGVTFSTSCYIKGILDDSSKCVNPTSTYVYISDLSMIVDGVYGGSVYLTAGNTLTQNLEIGGNISCEYNFCLDGHSVSCNDYVQTDSCLELMGGRLYVAGDCSFDANTYLFMTNERDYMRVKGNLTIGTKYTYNLFTAGTLEVCGNLSTTAYNTFTCTGTHTTILSGKLTESGKDYIQYITFNNSENKFNKLILRKNVDTCYVFNKEIDAMCSLVVYGSTDQIAPEKVTGIKVTEVTVSSVRIEWEESTDNEGVVGYKVFRGTKFAGITDGLSFTDSGLEPQTSYTYTVCAYDEAQNLSMDSDEVIGTTLADTEAPTKPAGITLSTWTGSSVTFIWSGSQDNVKVASYKIYRDGEEYTTVDSTVKVYKDSGLAAGERHTYALTALDGSGNESEISRAVSATTEMPEIIRMTPADGAVIGGRNTALKLYYKNSGNSLGNKVRFRYSDDEGETWMDINNSLVGQNVYNSSTLYSTYTWNISRFEDGKYLVQAILYDGDNNTDTMELKYEIDTTGPDTPDYIEAVSENGIVTVSWSESDTANCSYYKIYRASGDGAFSQIATLNGRANTTYIDTNVVEGKTYTYYVIPVDVFLQSGDASEKTGIKVTVDEEAPKVNRIALTREKVNGNTVFTIDASDNIEVTSSRIEYYDGENWVVIGESADERYRVKVSGQLPKDGKYKFRGVAIDARGNEGTGGITVLEVDTTGVGKPSISSVTSTSNTVRIVWEQPADKDFDYYIIEQKTDDGFEQVAKEGTTLGVYIRNLTLDTKYTFRIAGYDTTGNIGEYSDEISIRTKSDTTAPNIKEFGPAISYYTDSIPLSIQATDDNGLGELTISYSTDNKDWIEAATICAPENTTSYVYKYHLDISKLPEGEVYVHIDLSDACQNTYTKDVTRTFYHDFTAPAAMENIMATGHDGYIEVRWEKPSEEDLASFDLYRMDNNTGEYKCVSRAITSLNYIDTSISEDETYSYKIRVNDQAGNQSEDSKVVMAKCLEDTTAPKIYGISPSDNSTVGVNATIKTLAADNRKLKNVLIEYHKVGAADLWVEVYNEDISVVSKTISATWDNEGLEEGDYEVRVVATDAKGNVSDEYVVAYTYSRTDGEEGKDEGQDSTVTEEDSITVVAEAANIQRCGREYTFDATNCISTASTVDTYTWDFGDGTTAAGAMVTHAYEVEGDYKVTLTVMDTKGNSKSTFANVSVVKRSSGGIAVSVNSESGAALSGAYIYMEDANGNEILSTECDSSGELEVALEAGTYTVSTYSSGCLPKKQQVKITPGSTKKLAFTLEKDEVVVGTLAHRQLDVSEMIELGIDLTDEDNWYTYTYTVVFYVNGIPSEESYEFNLSKGGTVHFSSGGHSYTCTTAKGNGGEKVLVWYHTEQWLKQMFKVELSLKNQAGESFTITDGVAELVLPNGLSLATMTTKTQSLRVSVPDMSGQTEQVIDWCVRGDKPGSYNLSAKFNGKLQPFNAPVSAVIESQESLEITEQNENTTTDSGFVDADNAKTYKLNVSDYDNNAVKGAYVILKDEDGKTARAITDSEGRAYFQVNKDENRTFKLTVTCAGYKDYVNNSYTANASGYCDTVYMVTKGGSYKDSFPDQNSQYDGDFALEYVRFESKNLATEAVTVNTYKKQTYSLKLAFSESVSNLQISLRGEGKDTKIILNENVSSNNVEVSVSSTDMIADMTMYVRVVDESSGTWHLFALNNLKITYEKPQGDDFEKFDYDTAVDCAIYSALAYDKDFSYNQNINCLSNKVSSKYDMDNVEQMSLFHKLLEDGYHYDADYYKRNYGDDNRHNCSYSIFYKYDFDYSPSRMYVCVVIRGTDSDEWYGNMDVTGQAYDAAEENHKDFALAAEDVYDNLCAFMTKHVCYNARVLVTGHSRGAAVSNLLAKKLIDHKSELRLKGVAAYTFATPAVTTKTDTNASKYNSIYNFCFDDDFVPQMPLAYWGFGRYGKTAMVDSESLSESNEDYMETRRKIKVKKEKINYNSEGTKKLIEHVEKYWDDVRSYYEEEYDWSVVSSNTLYGVMHDYIAPAAMGKTITGINTLIHRVAETSVYRAVCKFFIKGRLNKSLFGTHHIDNYYAALTNNGFDLSIFDGSASYPALSNRSVLKTSGKQTAGQMIQDSKDINQLKTFLKHQMDSYDEEGKEVKKPVYEIYGWDIDDVSTWDGISFDGDGNITRISLPMFTVDGQLDVSGYENLDELIIMYTDIDSINLQGCQSLKKLTAAYNTNLARIDLSDCVKLEDVNLSSNALTSIIWGDCRSLKSLRCDGNYLDIWSQSMQDVVSKVMENGGMLSYSEQYANSEFSYCEDEIELIQAFLSIGDNAEILGWDIEDVSSWTGVCWKPVSGQNHIDCIDIAGYDVSGELDVTSLTYLRELVCNNTKLTSLDISGLKYLVQVACFNSDLEELGMTANESLLYLDCLHNFLDLDEIETYCKNIAAREGAEVFYDKQYISAGRLAFNEKECETLEAFAGEQDNVRWNMDKPGSIPGVTWTVVDGEYRVEKIDLSSYDISGSINLAVFEEMTDVNLSLTGIEEVTLPDTLAGISKKAFYSCYNLKEIEIPASVSTMGDEAFGNCRSLERVTFKGDSPKNLGYNLITTENEEFTVYYYMSKNGWDSAYWEDYNIQGIRDFGDETIGPEEPEEPTATEEPKDVEETPVTTATPLPEKNVVSGNTEETEEAEENDGEERQVQKGHKVTVSKVKIKAIKQSRKSVNVVVKKNKKVTGYVVAYRQGNKGKYKTVVLKSWKKNTAVLKKLKKGKCYRIKVRAYLVVDGKTYYSVYSKVKKFKKK